MATSQMYFLINNIYLLVMRSLLPVSYTHLDVYKRQGQRRVPGRKLFHL